MAAYTVGVFTPMRPTCHSWRRIDSVGMRRGSAVATLVSYSTNGQVAPPKDLSPSPTHTSQLCVAYQGMPGAYSEEAVGKAYPGCKAIPCEQFDDVFQAVESWVVDHAVLPLENSLGGSIHRNYDLLLRHHLHIVGEVQLPVHHCLVALPGVRVESLTRVVSHPQALAQCEHTLGRLGGNFVRQNMDDTAGSAEYVARNGLVDTAAIASVRAAELYGLEVVATGIQDNPNNVTRFMLLARDPLEPCTDWPVKTSIAFAANGNEGPSVLFKVLSAFALRGIGLTKIESRPYQNRPIQADRATTPVVPKFDYIFFLDFEASLAEPRVQNALATVTEFTSFLRVLGSYRRDLTC